MLNKAILATLFILAPALFAQAVRYDNAVYTTSGQVPAGALAPVLSIPGSTLAVCADAACISRATTYTSATAATPCPPLAPLTAPTGSLVCNSLSDNQGNFGWYILPGSYWYRITLPAGAGGGSFIYPISVGASAGCPLGVTCDANFSTLPAACTAAGSGLLYVTRTWNAQVTQTFACPMAFTGNGKIQPASGQTVTFQVQSAPLSQICDISTGGNCVIKAAVLYPQYWGAKMDGTTDDSSAWTAAISACGACTLSIPTNTTSRVASTINLSGPGQAIVGQGKNSIISGSGITIVKLSGSITGGQKLENLQIQDPTGNAATIGLLVDNGSVSNQVYLHNLAVFGNSSLKLGIGIKLNNTVNVHFDEAVEEFFGTGLLAGGMFDTTLRLDHSVFYGNGARGVDYQVTSTSEMSCNGSDIEGNGTQGVYFKGVTFLTSACHYENNAASHIELASGLVTSIGNSYEGGTLLIDASAGNSQFTSVNENLSGVTLTNNAATGGNQPALVLFYPTYSPTINGTGWTQLFTRSGISQIGAPLVTPYTFTGATLSGVSGYTFDLPITAPVYQNVGTPFTVTGCGTVSAASSATGGILISTVTGVCTTTINLPLAAHNWNCYATNQTSGAVFLQTGRGVDHCTLSGTTVTADQLNIQAFPN